MNGEIRGRGLMIGLEIPGDGSRSLGAIKKMLHRGFIMLPEGARGEVISFTPPLTITRAELDSAVAALKEVLA